MPTYEFACDPCRKLYVTDRGINDPRPTHCPSCSEPIYQVLSAPMLNTKNFMSPTAAKYANMSVSEEMAREKKLQHIYETIWIPPEAKHSPWEEDDH